MSRVRQLMTAVASAGKLTDRLTVQLDAANALNARLLEALQRLERRGYLAASTCATDDANEDLAFARAAIIEATTTAP